MTGTSILPSNRQFAHQLQAFIESCASLVVITGAGVSTASGIPGYRDREGNWKHAQPMQHSDFMSSKSARQLYWSRSFAGWKRIGRAQPNPAHIALAQLEQDGFVAGIITQNVDGLHRQAGNDRVVDLHGRLHEVICMQCGDLRKRNDFQLFLETVNPHWQAATIELKPDGDANLGEHDHRDFTVPACEICGGIVKPHVVFFGDSVPHQRYQRALDLSDKADGLLVVGSSLMVYSGYRFVSKAAERGMAITILNQGITRADQLPVIKLEAACHEVLPLVVSGLSARAIKVQTG